MKMFFYFSDANLKFVLSIANRKMLNFYCKRLSKIEICKDKRLFIVKYF